VSHDNIHTILDEILSNRDVINTIRFTELERQIATLKQENNTIRQGIILLEDADDNMRVINTQERDMDALFVTARHTDLMTRFENISATSGVLFQIMREMCREMRAIEPRVDSEVCAIQLALITRFEGIMTDRGGLFQDMLNLQANMRALQTRVQTLDTGAPLPQ